MTHAGRDSTGSRRAQIFGWVAVTAMVTAGGLALWFGLPLAYRLLVSLTQEVAVSLVVGVLTVGALLWRRASEVKEQREAHIRDQKVPVYEGFLRFWFKMLYQGGKGKQAPNQQVLNQHMVDSVPGFVFWASDDVIRQWNELRRSMAAADESRGIEKLFELEDLMLAMRADLGHDNAKLQRGDLLGLWVNDIHTVIAKNPEPRQ